MEHILIEDNTKVLAKDMFWHILTYCDMPTICNMCISECFNDIIERYLQYSRHSIDTFDVYYQIAIQAVLGDTDYKLECFDSISTDILQYEHTFNIIAGDYIDIHIYEDGKCSGISIILDNYTAFTIWHTSTMSHVIANIYLHGNIILWPESTHHHKSTYIIKRGYVCANREPIKLRYELYECVNIMFDLN